MLIKNVKLFLLTLFCSVCYQQQAYSGSIGNDNWVLTQWIEKQLCDGKAEEIGMSCIPNSLGKYFTIKGSNCSLNTVLRTQIFNQVNGLLKQACDSTKYAGDFLGHVKSVTTSYSPAYKGEILRGIECKNGYIHPSSAEDKNFTFICIQQNDKKSTVTTSPLVPTTTSSSGGVYTDYDPKAASQAKEVENSRTKVNAKYAEDMLTKPWETYQTEAAIEPPVTGTTAVATVTDSSVISTGDQSAYSGYDPAKASKQLHSTPEPIVNKQEPDEEEITIAQSANQSNIETGDNPAREICVKAKGRWDKDRDWCECPNGFQWNEDESEEKSIGCYQEDMPSNDKKEVNIDSNNQTSGTSSTRQSAKNEAETITAQSAKQSNIETEENTRAKKICEEQEKGKWITQGNTSTCTCPNQSQGYFWNKDRKQCEYEDTDATPEEVCTNGGATLKQETCICNNEKEIWDNKTKKCITTQEEKKIIAGTPCKIDNATTAMYKKDKNNQLACKVVTCNPNYKKNATETACEAQQKETKEKCKELPANATAGIMEKNGSTKSCKVTDCSSGYKVSADGKTCVEQSEEEKAQEKTNLEKEYETDMEELHKAFLDKIEQLKQSNNK